MAKWSSKKMAHMTRWAKKGMPMKKKSNKALTKKVNYLMKNAIATRPEKIRTQRNAFVVPVGQVIGVSEGASIFDVTPAVSQGDQTGGTTANRQGASINLMSSHYNFQIAQMTDNNFRVRVRFTWVAIKGAPYTNVTLVSDFFNNMYQPNPFVTGVDIRDANSNLNPDYFGTYKILRTKTVYLGSDNISGQLLSNSFQVGFKYNRGKGHSVRYNQNLTSLFDGQILMIVQTDRGNASASVTSTGIGGIYSVGTNTGITVSYNRQDYYYDV